MSVREQHPESSSEKPHTTAIKQNFLANISQVVSSISTVIGLSLAGATILGAAWVAVGWMRFYGIEVGVLPMALPVEPYDYNNPFLALIGRALDFYNCTFQGNSRFGSGLGLITGASIALLLIPAGKRAGRIAGALVAGVLVGGRVSLTFTSDPAPFLASALLTALLFFAIEQVTRQRLPLLPGVEYWRTAMPEASVVHE
ncbi:MAG: hypothetical protein K2X93_26095 [Candidatus Obscuribacterales bacterium]|nr:hypothetical protein [Candidatus Obscuribacterales bacterium]